MVLEQIIKMVAEQFMIDENEISADTSFVDDLGADSLDVVELTMALEETFSLWKRDWAIRSETGRCSKRR